MATYTASSSVQQSVVVGYAKTGGIDNGNNAVTFNVPQSLSSSDVSKVWTNSYTAQSGAVTLDLSSLTDFYGQAIAFTSLKGAYVYNNHATAALVIGGGADPALGTDQYTVKAGKLLTITSTFTIDGTHKNLVLTPSASMSFQLILVGS